MDTINTPHRTLMTDAGLNLQDLPEITQNAIRRYNEKEKTYLSTKKRFENKSEVWDKKQEFEDKLLELDEDASNKITRFLDEKEGTSELAQRATAVNLPANASEAEIAAAEKKRTAISQRAKAAGLREDASEAKVIEAENAAGKAVSDKAAADKAETEKAAAAKAAESKLPQDQLSLKKLYEAGNLKPTYEDLKVAKFPLGFFGPIGMNGCTCGKYRLYREHQYDSTFQLTKTA